jgi:hypothetical protein
MAIPEAGTHRLTEFQPATTGGIREGAPLAFQRGPTFRFVPTLAQEWGQKKSININRVPTGPTCATNFLSSLIGMTRPR